MPGRSPCPILSRNMINMVSWNVNGIRAAARKGLLDVIQEMDADVFGLQETKASPDQLDEELLSPPGYRSWFASALKKGYSGVAIYSRIEPQEVGEFGDPAYDDEGRVLQAHFDGWTLLNCYFPNSQAEGARLDYKIAFCEDLMRRCDELVASGRHVVVCGDYNIAHKPIDLARPKDNEGSPGYLPEERAWMDRFTRAGYVDTFRMFEPGPDNYTWWSFRAQARQKNIGWRLDYHCVDPGLTDRVASSRIHPGITGSDHCPVSMELRD